MSTPKPGYSGHRYSCRSRSAGPSLATARWRRVPRAVTIFALAMVMQVGLVTAVGATWLWPIDAPVTDEFRNPENQYGSGNRGLEFGASEDKKVFVVDAGVVGFVGVVGSARHVVVHHQGDLRSTYAYLASSVVVRGQRVVAGQELGVAASGFHLTARLGDDYVDPALLLAGAEVVIQLTDSPPPQARTGSLVGNSAAGGSVSVGSVSVGSASGGEVAGGTAAWRSLAALEGLTHAGLTQLLLSAGAAANEWHRSDCSSVQGGQVLDATGQAVPVSVAGEGRILIQVAGLGSQADEASIGLLDAEQLGYSSQDIVGFSYAGGCTPQPFGSVQPTAGSLGHDMVLAGQAATAYASTDTYQSVDISAAYLADLVEQAAMARPGQPIDIAAHSLGGLVTRRALEILNERQHSTAAVPGAMPNVVITIGSPHQGAELAVGAGALADPVPGSLVPALVPDWLASDVLGELATFGPDQLGPAVEPPDGVTVIAVAGQADLIVPATSALWPGAENVVVSTSSVAASSHSALPAHPDVALEFALALSGAAPRCVGLGDVLSASGAGAATTLVERGANAAIGIGRWLL